jgi:hypothetical protein
MVDVVPSPEPDARPFNEPASVTLDPGQKATVRFTPEQRVTEFTLPILAISKARNTLYQARIDDTIRFGPAPAPPTDIDDMGVTFLPALSFSQSLEVEITRVSAAAGTQTYFIQPVGWEPTGGASDGA